MTQIIAISNKVSVTDSILEPTACTAIGAIADYTLTFFEVVRDRFSIKASTNSPVDICSSFANRSKVSSSGICLWLNHTDQLGGSTFVRRFNSLYDSFKNSSLVSGLSLQVCIGFTKFFRCVIVRNNKVALLPRITQTIKHLRKQVLYQQTRKDGRLRKKTYDKYIRPKGRLASPSFTVPRSLLGGTFFRLWSFAFYAAMGGIG